jgi:hypothetical protein
MSRKGLLSQRLFTADYFKVIHELNQSPPLRIYDKCHIDVIAKTTNVSKINPSLAQTQLVPRPMAKL